MSQGNDGSRLGGGARPGSLDRRAFLRHLGAAGVVLGTGGLLGSCGSDDADAPSARGPAGLPGELTIANWPAYVDPGGQASPFDTSSIDDFALAAGIEIDYLEEVFDNADWFEKMREKLEQNRPIERDLVVLTDWMAARLVERGWAERLDRASMPNAENLLAALAHPTFDPERAFTLPWQASLTSVVYDPRRTGRELTSIDEVFDPAFAGRVSFLRDMRDSLGLVMLAMGHDPSTAGITEAESAIDRIDQAVQTGQVAGFTGKEYGEALLSGEIWVAFGWSGDAVQLRHDEPELRFLLPEEGLMVWTDEMLIPAGALNKATAEMFMDFMYDPAVAAKLSGWVNYVSPVEGADHAMWTMGEQYQDAELMSLAGDPLLFPDDETWARARTFRVLSEDEDHRLAEAFGAVTGA